MKTEDYNSQNLSIMQELSRMEKIGWGNEKTDSTIFPYVIIEAINLLMNSVAHERLMDYTQTGESAQAMVDDIWAGIACGNGCCVDETYSFVPEAGCPIHDLPRSPEKVSFLELYSAPCHSNYGESHCCGIFNVIKDGNLICNECGMGIFELLETQAGRKAKPSM